MNNPNAFPSDRIVTGSLVYTLSGSGAERAVLLLKRNKMPHQGLWSPPGGKLEMGEAPEECATREIREETGLTVLGLTLRGIITVYDRAWPIHWLLFIYRAAVEALYPPLLDCHEGELRWIPLRDLAQYPRPYADAQYFPRVLDDTPLFQSKFVYDTPATLVGEWHYG
ncbi:MAG: NUDIX domain-containing protein [Chloroflexi bacterium]|nr:NUDIX domain-containing protein [Chloroflexota bacterium]